MKGTIRKSTLGASIEYQQGTPDRDTLVYAMRSYGYILNRSDRMHRNIPLGEFADMIEAEFDSNDQRLVEVVAALRRN